MMMVIPARGSTDREQGGLHLPIPDRRDYSAGMMSNGALRDCGRGLLAAACGVVLIFQFMSSALAGSTHLGAKCDAGEISLIELCGNVPSSECHRTHVDGVDTCCVSAKTISLAPLAPPAPVSLIPERVEPVMAIFAPSAAASVAFSPEGPPQATGPPRRS